MRRTRPAVAANSRVAAPRRASEREGLVDEEGLPLVYDRNAIQSYWETQGGALQSRWVEFLGVTVPFITRVAGLLLSGGTDALESNAQDLAKDARVNLEKLGPTYIKMGQMMSVRPDVLPQAALDEVRHAARPERSAARRAPPSAARAKRLAARAPMRLVGVGPVPLLRPRASTPRSRCATARARTRSHAALRRPLRRASSRSCRCCRTTWRASPPRRRSRRSRRSLACR